MNVTTNEEHLHFINFMKLIEESNTSEVLGSFCADHAALFTVSKNLLTNELSLSLQKDGNPIYSLIFTSYFPGGVPATNYKNYFRFCSSTRQHQPRMLDNGGSVSLIFNYSTPRCALTMHVSSAVIFCDSNVESRGVFSMRIAASLIILMGVLCWCENIVYCIQISFQLLISWLLSSQLPADSRSSASS